MLKADALHFLNLVCLTLKKKKLDHYLLNKGKLKTAITAFNHLYVNVDQRGMLSFRLGSKHKI